MTAGTSGLFHDVRSIIDTWDDMTDGERVRMPPDVWDAIITLRRILDEDAPESCAARPHVCDFRDGTCADA